MDMVFDIIVFEFLLWEYIDEGLEYVLIFNFFIGVSEVYLCYFI